MKSVGDVCPGVVGREKLCHPQEDRIPKGRKDCSPVTSAPKAKFPLPTWSGVEFELACRTGLKVLTTFLRSIMQHPGANKSEATRETEAVAFMTCRIVECSTKTRSNYLTTSWKHSTMSLMFILTIDPLHAGSIFPSQREHIQRA